MGANIMQKAMNFTTWFVQGSFYSMFGRSRFIRPAVGLAFIGFALSRRKKFTSPEDAHGVYAYFPVEIDTLPNSVRAVTRGEVR